MRYIWLCVRGSVFQRAREALGSPARSFPGFPARVGSAGYLYAAVGDQERRWTGRSLSVWVARERVNAEMTPPEVV